MASGRGRIRCHAEPIRFAWRELRIPCHAGPALREKHLCSPFPHLSGHAEPIRFTRRELRIPCHAERKGQLQRSFAPTSRGSG